MAAKIIYACAILHNMCVEYNIEIEDEEESEDEDGDEDDNEDDDDSEDEVEQNQNWFNAGRNIRNNLINQYFT